MSRDRMIHADLHAVALIPHRRAVTEHGILHPLLDRQGPDDISTVEFSRVLTLSRCQNLLDGDAQRWQQHQSDRDYSAQRHHRKGRRPPCARALQKQQGDRNDRCSPCRLGLC